MRTLLIEDAISGARWCQRRRPLTLTQMESTMLRVMAVRPCRMHTRRHLFDVRRRGVTAGESPQGHRIDYSQRKAAVKKCWGSAKGRCNVVSRDVMPTRSQLLGMPRKAGEVTRAQHSQPQHQECLA